jgi:hypothetical protein
MQFLPLAVAASRKAQERREVARARAHFLAAPLATAGCAAEADA